VHVQSADAEGNCRIDGPSWKMKTGQGRSSPDRHPEEIVPTETIQKEPERTIIPAHRVEAVIHQPFGAHPTAVFGCYDYDAAHLKLYVDHSSVPNASATTFKLHSFDQESRHVLEKVAAFGIWKA